MTEDEINVTDDKKTVISNVRFSAPKLLNFDVSFPESYYTNRLNKSKSNSVRDNSLEVQIALQKSLKETFHNTVLVSSAAGVGQDAVFHVEMKPGHGVDSYPYFIDDLVSKFEKSKKTRHTVTLGKDAFVSYDAYRNIVENQQFDKEDLKTTGVPHTAGGLEKDLDKVIKDALRGKGTTEVRFQM